MTQKTKGKAVAVFVGESDHIHGKPVYAAIVEAAKKHGLAGATATRAMMGYGAHSQIHTANIVILAEDLPIVVSLIDTHENIVAFIPILEQLVPEGTLEIVFSEKSPVIGLLALLREYR